jgi:predicted transcriptional regulator
MLFVTTILGVIYTGYLFNNIEFGPNYIRRVKIPKAPTDIERLLKTTNQDGDLIFVYLLSAFVNEEETLSKSDMHRWIQNKGHIDLTYQATLPYIDTLEKKGLISSPKVTRDYEYVLTKTGKWCAEAIRVCFPRTYFWFLLRHAFGLRPLKEYP